MLLGSCPKCTQNNACLNPSYTYWSMIMLGRCKLLWFNINKNYTFYKSIQFFLNDSNVHGYYFLKCYYSNIWIIHVQSSRNLSKSMWKLIFNVTNVIFLFGSSKRKTHKVHKNNAPSKTFKKYASRTKKLKNK